MQEVQTANGHRPHVRTTPRGHRPRMNCPACGSPNHSDKVSTIVHSGRGKLIFENGEVARYETELAQLLAEPQQPREVPLLRAALDALPPLLVLGVLLVGVAFLDAQDYVSLPARSMEVARNVALVWFGVLIPGVLIVRYGQARLDREREMPAWITAHRRWTSLYYCSRDDVVFSPVLNAVASPREIGGMLYAGTGSTSDGARRFRPAQGELQ